MQFSDIAKKSECVSAISTLSDIQYLKLGINAEQNNFCKSWTILDRMWFNDNILKVYSCEVLFSTLNY